MRLPAEQMQTNEKHARANATHNERRAALSRVGAQEPALYGKDQEGRRRNVLDRADRSLPVPIERLLEACRDCGRTEPSHHSLSKEQTHPVRAVCDL